MQTGVSITDFFNFRKFSYAYKGDLKVAPTLGDAIINKISVIYSNGRDNDSGSL